MKKITFVVLHYRDVSSTKACIKSLCEMTPVKEIVLSIIMVDNNSPEPFPREKIISNNAEVSFVFNTDNLGYSGGNNTGITKALDDGADFVAVLNNDTIVDKNFLEEINKFLLLKKLPGILVPKIYFYPGTEFHHDRYEKKDLGKVIWYAGGEIDWQNVLASHRGVDEVDVGQYDHETETAFATGCCIIFPREVLEKVGTFDDEYYLYFEDIDLSMRIKKAGYKIYFVPKAILWHKNAKSSGGSGSALQDYYISRNRMLFAMRYAPLRARIAVIREGISYLLSGRRWQKQAVADFFFRRFGKGTFIISHAKD